MNKTLIFLSICALFICNRSTFAQPRTLVRAGNTIYKLLSSRISPACVAYSSNYLAASSKTALKTSPTARPNRHFSVLTGNAMDRIKETKKPPLNQFTLVHDDMKLSDHSPIENILSHAPLYIEDVYESIITLKSDPQAIIYSIGREDLDAFAERVGREDIGLESLFKLEVFSNDSYQTGYLWIHNLTKGYYTIAVGSAEKRFLISAQLLKKLIKSMNGPLPSDEESESLAYVLNALFESEITKVEFTEGFELPCTDR
ncbi:MAG: hypothetical protein HRU09_10555 [Oligoflexales bacterium]|nr:hypothetical protein [Oligoflexales bacterium]